ncbi:PilZ domain-containing protein [Hyalangium rubrum]|uniref:PilZ domain-containing protein n=1 Tax=Hyalangium rubrum TaxID=3103134 RepID=A0ABU5HEY5_9BACT|nr:PilZ domain-containing protein [Hyalangium sp. s54d21]MDY7231811.1 PilZ domain-containing protein [Hyalangium sp. s54d21]
MSINAWLQEFRALHKRARQKQLNAEEKELYLTAREQFARALTAAQGMTLKPGEMARQTFRVAQAMQIELSLNSGIVRAMTLDVSRGGFSVVLGKPPGENEQVGYTLRMPDGMDPIIGRARVVASKKQIGNYRLSFSFENMSDHDGERLEGVLFDAALSRIPG